MVSKRAWVLLLGNLISWPENTWLLVSPVLCTFREKRTWMLYLLYMPKMRVLQNHLLMHPWHGCLCSFTVREGASGINISQVPSLWFSSLEVLSVFLLWLLTDAIHLHSTCPSIPRVRQQCWLAAYNFTLFPCTQESILGDFPGDPVVKTLCSQFRGPRFDPWSGN